MDKRIPQSYDERSNLRQLAHKFVLDKGVQPPISSDKLRLLSAEFAEKYHISCSLQDWLMVELHNGIWLPVISRIPYERRLLLLPKCLRDSGQCEGEMDDIGLLCHQCGRCAIPDLQTFADEHGILSMVAEGFTSVIELIRNHVVDAVIGVSCLDSLEKAFPLLISHAVPGIAVALNDGGCRDTHVDEAYIRQLLPQHNGKALKLLNYDELKAVVDEWFTPDGLAQVLNPSTDVTSKAAIDWMLSGGNRWRPFLLTAVYIALSNNPSTVVPDEVKRAAIAVECFHKASLVHDDIQDNDAERYGQATVNAKYGEAMAINIGDLLLGYGYQLLTSLPDNRMMSEVASAHVNLCLGQGAELAWSPGQYVTVDDVLEIFRRKTVPAFEVALVLGGLAATCELDTLDLLRKYSSALGIAYQLKDDLEDFYCENTEKPSVVYALKQEHPEATDDDIRERIIAMLDSCRNDALTMLARTDCFELKRLLFQTTEKLLER